MSARTHTIVALIGSTSFKPAFMHKARELTWQGYLVWMPIIWSNYTGEKITVDEERFLDLRYKEKIKMSDEVFVINDVRDGRYYIGSSTQNEIEFAEKLKMPIKYLNNPLTQPPQMKDKSKNGGSAMLNYTWINYADNDPAIGCTS